MSSPMSLAIKQLVQDRGISTDLVMKTIEEALLAAYKRRFGTSDNAIVKFTEELTDVVIYSQKMIVEDVYDPVTEIALEDALEYNEGCELGDELLIEINPKEFDRISIQSAKQKARQSLREIQKDTLFSEYKDKVGEMIIGYYQRERNGTIFVDLGKTEGILPRRFQSPREVYHANDRIKALIYEVNKAPAGVQIVLSRTHTEFVKRIFELEVPEVYDRTVEMFKIVREPGYRTKLAVYSNRDDVDPVGACVGVKGVRIQAVVREMEGEKIDILKYDPDPRTFIKNALSPAEVLHVVLLDDAKKQALAVVSENHFSLAIGKQGLNVRLANRLVDWNIDVKTEEQFAEMDLGAESKRAMSALFGEPEEEEEITTIAELPGINERYVDILRSAGIELIEDLVAKTEDQLAGLEGMTKDDARSVLRIIEDSVEIVEDDAETLGAEQATEDVDLETELDEELAEEGEDEEADAEADAFEQEEPIDEQVEADSEDDEVAPEDMAGDAAAELVESDVAETEDTEEDQAEVEVVEEEISQIAELPGISDDQVAVLKASGREEIESLLSMEKDDLLALEGMSEGMADALLALIDENVEVVEEDEEDEEDEEIESPESEG